MTDAADSSKQVTLPVSDLDALIEAKIDAKLAQGMGPKHYIPKGDPYWILARENARRLQRELGAVCYNDVENDPWFQKESPKLDLTDHAGLDHVVKWNRFVKKLVRGDPRAEGDTSEFVFFDVPCRGGRTRFVCLRGEVHCAVDRACTKVGLSGERRGAVVANVRRKWNAGDSCPRCPVV